MGGLSEADREKVSLFVDEMRAQREQRGWSREELARRVNYSVSLIAMVETYQRGPTLAPPTATAGPWPSPPRPGRASPTACGNAGQVLQGTAFR
jgi:Helix-turn-helix domain